MSKQKNDNHDFPEAFKLTDLGPLPEEWEVVNLGEVLEEVDVRVSDFNSGDARQFPVLSLTKNQGLILQSERFGKRIAIDDVSDYKVVRRGQIVYNPYVIWEGAVHILRDYEHGLVSPVYPVWEAKSDRAEAYFIDRFLRMPAAIAAYNRFAAGAVNRRRAIRKTDFLSIQIPLPPFSEQQTIAHVLSTIQRAVEAQDKILAAGRELKKSLMRHLFTYGPVPPEEARSRSFGMKETEIGMVPEHWEVISLGALYKSKVLVLQNGFPCGNHNDQGIGIPHLRPMNIDSDGRIVLETVKYIQTEMDVSRYLLKERDVIFNNTNSEELVGKTAYWDREGSYVLSNHMTILRTLQHNVVDPLYIAKFLHKKWYDGYYLGTCRRHVNQASLSLERLKQIPIPLPAIPDQHAIARILSTVDKKIEAEEKRKAALQALFKTMLHLLMTGRLRVKEFNLT